jgi:hypothetical protein
MPFDTEFQAQNPRQIPGMTDMILFLPMLPSLPTQPAESFVAGLTSDMIFHFAVALKIEAELQASTLRGNSDEESRGSCFVCQATGLIIVTCHGQYPEEVDAT